MANSEAPGHAGSHSPTQTIRALRVIGLGAVPIAASFAATGFIPVLALIVPVIVLILALTLIGIAVFGPQDRVFRLLRWLRDRPEPPRPDN